MTARTPFRIGVLGSDKGSNFVAIADAISRGDVPAEVAIVISDVENAGILQHARDRGLRAEFVAPGKFRTKLDEETERVWIGKLQEAKVDLVVLAGFMRILKGDFFACISRARREYPPLFAPGVSGFGSLEAGLGAWR